MRRVNRKGFFQYRVLSRLGYFPWECVFCREPQFFRDDGVTRAADDSGSHASAPVAPAAPKFPA